MAERLLDSIESTRIQAERAVRDKFGRDIYNTYAEREKVAREVERVKPLVGSGAPTETPQYEGQVYVDTLHKVTYKAYGTSSVDDWKEMASKEYVDGIVGDIESLLAAL